MANLHSPERQASESFEAYKARRKASKAAARRMTLAGIGDQHKLPSQRAQLRNEQRRNGKFVAGSYGKAILAYCARKARDRMAAKSAAA